MACCETFDCMCIPCTAVHRGGSGWHQGAPRCFHLTASCRLRAACQGPSVCRMPRPVSMPLLTQHIQPQCMTSLHHQQVPEDTQPAAALATMLAWLAALPAPLLPASAARGAERVLPLVFEAEAWLSDALPPADWAAFRHIISAWPLLCLCLLARAVCRWLVMGWRLIELGQGVNGSLWGC